jgi:hypothetical protein
VRLVPRDRKIKSLVFPGLCQQVPSTAAPPQSDCDVKSDYSLVTCRACRHGSQSVTAAHGDHMLLANLRGAHRRLFGAAELRLTHLHSPHLFATGGGAR